MLAEFDFQYWSLPDVRVISDTEIEVDSCEVWSNQYYEQSTDELVESTPPELTPQTITIKRLVSNWFITEIQFFEPPHFCPAIAAASPPPTPTTAPILIDGQEPLAFVVGFWSEAVPAEIRTLDLLNPEYAAAYEAGQALRNVETYVADLVRRGVYEVATFDWASWRVMDVRIISDTKIQVDSCEIWTSKFYDVNNDALVSSDPPRLLPQTVTLERLGRDWFWTGIVFFDPPHFCP